MEALRQLSQLQGYDQQTSHLKTESCITPLIYLKDVYFFVLLTMILVKLFIAELNL